MLRMICFCCALSGDVTALESGAAGYFAVDIIFCRFGVGGCSLLGWELDIVQGIG